MLTYITCNRAKVSKASIVALVAIVTLLIVALTFIMMNTSTLVAYNGTPFIILLHSVNNIVLEMFT